MSGGFLWTSHADVQVLTNQLEELLVDTGCSLEDRPEVMEDRKN